MTWRQCQWKDSDTGKEKGKGKAEEKGKGKAKEKGRGGSRRKAGPRLLVEGDGVRGDGGREGRGGGRGVRNGRPVDLQLEVRQRARLRAAGHGTARRVRRRRGGRR